MTITKHLLVRGRVQGVFFRAWTVKAASASGLVGWVRNRKDGDVEAVVQGNEAAVGQFIKDVWIGPPSARVDDVDITDHLAVAIDSFEQRPDA